MNTSTHTAILDNKTICIQFPYDMQIIQAVRDIPGREWNSNARQWEVPSTPWHMSKVIETLKPFKFYIDPIIIQNANGKAEAPKLRLPSNLYDYQKDGVKFIYKTQGRCIVADDMGLGKTAESLVFVDQFCGKTLVVAPSNVLFKWALKEVPMWAKGKTVQVILTGKQKIENMDITVLSYGIMVSKFEELNQLPFDCIIFDESHYIKSPKAQRTRVAKALVKGVPHLLFLSGTPFMNRPSELYTSLNMIDPRGFNNFYHYAARYCGFEYIGGHWMKPERETVTHADELAARLGHVMLRRTKRDVAIDLPDLTRITLPVVIDNMADYRRAIADFRQKRRDNPTKNPANVLVQLSQLRQVVGQGKVKAAVELAESVLQNGEQIVLFAHHKDVVAALADALKSYGVGIISGDTKPKDRDILSNTFLMQDSKLRVMIITVAGAEGIDLFSAWTICFVEREWTPAREEQAEARLHRNGQKNAVSSYYIVAANTIDQKFDDVVSQKRAMFGQVIHTDEIVNTILEGLDE
jgi:SWI/SNF-related matrix-associated actin-dependent regulator 1 of chromatin subfamily A